jgi:hypothetical protein
MWSGTRRSTVRRRACTTIGAEAVLTAKFNRVDLEPLDGAAYRERKRVERLTAKPKESRRVATRCKKLTRTLLGMIYLALGFIRLRAKTSVNKTWFLHCTASRPLRVMASTGLLPGQILPGHGDGAPMFWCRSYCGRATNPQSAVPAAVTADP